MCVRLPKIELHPAAEYDAPAQSEERTTPASSRIRERASVLKQLALIALLLIVAAAVSPAQQTLSSTQVTVIRAGRLVDVDVGRVLTSQLLLLRGGKIEAMGENLPIPAGATDRKSVV